MIDASEYRALAREARYGKHIPPFARLFDDTGICETLSEYLDQHVLRAAERGTYRIAISGLQVKKALDDMLEYENECAAVLEKAGAREQARSLHPMAYVKKDTSRKSLEYIIDRIIDYIRSEYSYWKVERFEGNELGIAIEA